MPILRRLEARQTLRSTFRRKFGKRFVASELQTFTEKLYGRMIGLSDQDDERFTTLTDKYAAREFIAARVGEDCLPRLFWHGTRPEDIPFSQLPRPCIIKTNHGSGKIIRVDSNVDEDRIRTNLRELLDENYYWACREYQYLHIKPLVLIEECLDDGFADGPLDYRLWCFRGKTEVIQVDNHKHDINPFYDPEWNKLDLRYRAQVTDCDVPKPKNLTQMLDIATTLSREIDFVRVDLYNLDGRIVVSEFTFSPVGGGLVLVPEAWDRFLGHKWDPYEWGVALE